MLVEQRIKLHVMLTCAQHSVASGKLKASLHVGQTNKPTGRTMAKRDVSVSICCSTTGGCMKKRNGAESLVDERCEGLSK